MLGAVETTSSSLLPDIVVLSPHLDDAVLSLGGLIARQVTQGARVEVWTVFSSGPPLEKIAEKHRLLGNYAKRHEEDERALALLGAGHRWLGFEERIWREPRLRNTMQLFRTPKTADKFIHVDAIVESIAPLLERPRVTLYAPLGVGNHFDHVEVALAAMRLMLARRAFERFAFYEDFYAWDAAARDRHFVTRRLTWGHFRATGWSIPALALLMRAEAWSARGPGIDTYLPEVTSLIWSCRREPIGEYEGAKLDAAAEYRSQVAGIGGFNRLSSYLQRAHALHGGELIWRAAPDLKEVHNP